ncbi:unnamed protein product [Moneuplotes crassus]|uniref:Uncharacterized protein n=1 Tax=Euplotes crassus TaxID=5936 RepID=A0AAD1U566_EUPCR|nr:unnamed protein product [Moneuplotes crassus]
MNFSRVLGLKTKEMIYFMSMKNIAENNLHTKHSNPKTICKNPVTTSPKTITKISPAPILNHITHLH